MNNKKRKNSEEKVLTINCSGAKGLTNRRTKNVKVFCRILLSTEKIDKIEEVETKKDGRPKDPVWNYENEFVLPKDLDEEINIKCTVYDGQKTNDEKYMGEVTVQFAPDSNKSVDKWYDLSSKNSTKVTGTIHLSLTYSGPSISIKKKQSKVIDLVEDGALMRSKSIIDQPFTVIKAKIVEWEKNRDGPENTKMIAFPKSQAQVSKDGYTVTGNNTGYWGWGNMESIKADCVLKTGKWYYEITLKNNGSLYLGFCTPDFDPANFKKGDCFLYDGYNNNKRRKDTSTPYGNGYWNSGDIIGCSIDFQKKSMHFYKNGNDLGEAFGTQEISKNMELIPFCQLSNNMSAFFNFGSSPFKYPIKGYNSIHIKLTNTQIAKLRSRFDHYLKVTVEAGNEDESSIHSEGVEKLQKDLSIDGEGDISFLVLSWKLDCSEFERITLDEWMNGFIVNGCEGMSDIQKNLKVWVEQVNSDCELFAIFYNWVFTYIKGEGKSIPFEQAKILWNLLLKNRKLKQTKKPWAYYDKWMEYCSKTDELKNIPQDLWNMLWVLMNKYPSSFDGYDSDNSSFPLKIDSFVEFTYGDESAEEDDDL